MCIPGKYNIVPMEVLMVLFMFVPCINSITFLLFQTDAHNYKSIGILKQLKFRLSLHVLAHAGTIIRELFRA